MVQLLHDLLFFCEWLWCDGLLLLGQGLVLFLADDQALPQLVYFPVGLLKKLLKLFLQLLQITLQFAFVILEPISFTRLPLVLNPYCVELFLHPPHDGVMLQNDHPNLLPMRLTQPSNLFFKRRVLCIQKCILFLQVPPINLQLITFLEHGFHVTLNLR